MLLTLCYEFFSTFPHGTSSLSDSDLYLRLEVSVSQIQTWFPTSLTQDTCSSCIFYLRDCHPLRFFFPKDLTKILGLNAGPKNPTSPCTFLCRIQFALCCFLSLIITVSHLISFPAGTKMLQFPALSYHYWPSQRIRSLIQESPVQWLRAPTWSISLLATLFFTIWTKSST